MIRAVAYESDFTNHYFSEQIQVKLPDQFVEPQKYTLNVTPKGVPMGGSEGTGEGGVSVIPDQELYNSGDIATIVARPVFGLDFSHWKVVQVFGFQESHLRAAVLPG